MKGDPQHILLGDWTIDPGTGEIRRGEETARLEPRVTEVLVYLARAHGRVVSKAELFESVWEGAAVTNDVLRRCVYSLRQAMGDDAEQPRYIRTLPRRGYQVVAEVSYAAPGLPRAVAGAGNGGPATLPPEPPSRPATAAHRSEVTTTTRRPVATAASGSKTTTTARRPVATAALLVLAAGGAFALHSAPTGRPGAPAPRAELVLADESPYPTTADEFFNLGIRHARQRDGDDLERAIALFNRALELDPEHARAHAELANAYALSVGGFYRDPGRFDLAIDHATIALGLDPTMVEANKALGIAFVGKGWYDSAAREYRRALERRPGYQAVINNLAIVEVNRGRLDEALALQRQLDTADESRALHLSNLGYTYRLLVDYASARRVLGASLEVMPDNVLAVSNLAAIDLAKGDLATARDRVRKILPLYPGDAPFLATAGLIELAAGDVERAAELFRTSADLSADGTNNRAWLGLAYIHLLHGETRAAQEIFDGFFAYAERARSLRRQDCWAPFNLAAIHAMNGDAEHAVEELRRAAARGYVDYRSLDTLPFFERVRNDAGYGALVSELRDRVAKMRNKAHEAVAR